MLTHPHPRERRPARVRRPPPSRSSSTSSSLTGKRLAIERNGEIVPRSRFADERLAEGDRIEVVVAVGGG
jgi:sulfur carrier protein